MTTATKHATGTPIWLDLSTPNLDGAIAFYQRIFGWNTTKGPEALGFYSTARLNGHKVAGMVPQQPGDNTPPAWTQYLASDNAEATAKTITDNHGQTFVPPMTVTDNGNWLGTMAIHADPTGGVFGVWQAGSHVGTEIQDAPGAPVWTELRSSDAQKATTFFGNVFGLPINPMENAGAEYYSATSNDHMVYGIWQMPSEMSGMPSHWSPHFGVSDIEATCAEIKAAGGKVLNGPEDSSYGRWATVSDPYGAQFTLLEVGRSQDAHAQ